MLLGEPLDPRQVLVVGDTPHDVEAAHGAGALAVGVATGHFDAEALRDAGADYVLGSLEEQLPLSAREVTTVTDPLVLEDPVGETAERLAAAASAGGQIALTGGSTARLAYERLAPTEVDWSRCTLWFGDERCVPPGDEDSNFGMFRESLLDRLRGKLRTCGGSPASWGRTPAQRPTSRSCAAPSGKEVLDSTSCCSASGRTGTVRLFSPVILHSRSGSGWRWASHDPALHPGFRA